MNTPFSLTYQELLTDFTTGEAAHVHRVDVGEWHAQDVRDKPMAVSHEMTNVLFECFIDEDIPTWQQQVQPNLPWAEKHFLERVSGQPYNPPPSHVEWPWANANAQHQDHEGAFSHSYPERFWPPRGHGIRFEYGDLHGVVQLLQRNLLTRQAYLPMFSMEDVTAAVKHQRVPCSLGWHFLMRGDYLHCNYFLRSCDIMRYLKDDVYLAGRLTQWIAEQLGTSAGVLTVFISSLHLFEGDLVMLRRSN